MNDDTLEIEHSARSVLNCIPFTPSYKIFRSDYKNTIVFDRNTFHCVVHDQRIFTDTKNGFKQ